MCKGKIRLASQWVIAHRGSNHHFSPLDHQMLSPLETQYFRFGVVTVCIGPLDFQHLNYQYLRYFSKTVIKVTEMALRGLQPIAASRLLSQDVLKTEYRVTINNICDAPWDMGGVNLYSERREPPNLIWWCTFMCLAKATARLSKGFVDKNTLTKSDDHFYKWFKSKKQISICKLNCIIRRNL